MKKKSLPLIPYIYRAKIKKIFNYWLKSLYQISNLGIFVILPDGDLLYVSTCYELSEIYVQRNFYKYDLMLKPNIYNKFSVFPWHMNINNKFINEINLTREKIFKLNSGTAYVRKVFNSTAEEYTIIYAISTYNEDPLIKYVYACQIDKIMPVCDYIYNLFKDVFQQFTPYKLPVIEDGLKLPQYDDQIIMNYSMEQDNMERILNIIQKDLDTTTFTNYFVEDLVQVVENTINNINLHKNV